MLKTLPMDASTEQLRLLVKLSQNPESQTKNFASVGLIGVFINLAVGLLTAPWNQGTDDG